MNSLEDSL